MSKAIKIIDFLIEYKAVIFLLLGIGGLATGGIIAYNDKVECEAKLEKYIMKPDAKREKEIIVKREKPQIIDKTKTVTIVNEKCSCDDLLTDHLVEFHGVKKGAR